MKVFLLLLAVLAGMFSGNAQSVKRLYIANDDHTDYMWTADEAKYDTAFVKMLDFYLNQIDSTRNNPPDFQARFNCDGSYWLRAYQKYRSPAQFERLIAAIRSGHISSPLNSLVSTYGAQPTEAVLRGMYYAGSLERVYNVRFTLAQTMENNTIPLGLSSLWAGAGAKYSYKGIGGYGSQMTYAYRDNRRNQLYRYTGLDGTSILMKWYNYNEKTAAPLGGYAECRLYPKKRPVPQTEELGRIIQKLENLCDTVSPASKYPFNVAGAFGYGWDDLDNYTSQPFIEAAIKGTTSTRKVRVSNEEDFFQDVAKSYPNLSAESVSYGNEWDIYCVSMNETTARVRRAVEKLRSAEALASVVSLKDKTFGRSLTALRQEAWEALGFYWEHNWTADGPVARSLRANWQIKLQTRLTRYVDSLFTLSSDALSRQLTKSSTPRFYVFNSLNWSRNDVADIPFEGMVPIVIDLTNNKEVVGQLITKGGKKFLRIQAENIPSVGYKVFEIRKGKPKIYPVAAAVLGNSITNSYYTLSLSPSGAITELHDRKAKNKSLVLPGNFLNNLGIENIREENTVEVENAGPISVTLKAQSAKPVPHTVRVTLFANNPRIQIEDSISGNFMNVKTWSFAFDLKNQVTRHEELGAILTAKKETRGGHYAAQNARLDWQTFNHFADMSESNYGITLSNQDCSFFKLGKSTVDSLWENSSELHALAGGQVDKKVEDGGMMGIFNQNGQKSFFYQFALTAHRTAFDATAAMKFSLEHQNPLTTGWIDGDQKEESPKTFSLLSINDPNVLLWSVKPSEEGMENGLIARFWNMNATAINPTIQVGSVIQKAWQTSHIETNERLLAPFKSTLNVAFRKHQMNTYRLILR